MTYNIFSGTLNLTQSTYSFEAHITIVRFGSASSWFFTRIYCVVPAKVMLNSSGDARWLCGLQLLGLTLLPAIMLLLPHAMTSESWWCDKRSLRCWSPWDSAINTSQCAHRSPAHVCLRNRRLLQQLITAQPPRLKSLVSRTNYL